MKKTYIVPQMLTVNVQTQHIMVASGGSKLMDKDTPANPEGEVLSRRSKDIWTDEDQENGEEY